MISRRAQALDNRVALQRRMTALAVRATDRSAVCGGRMGDYYHYGPPVVSGYELAMAVDTLG